MNVWKAALFLQHKWIICLCRSQQPHQQPRWEWVFLCCRQKFPTLQINNNMLEHQLSFVKPSLIATTVKCSANLRLWSCICLHQGLMFYMLCQCKSQQNKKLSFIYLFIERGSDKNHSCSGTGRLRQKEAEFWSCTVHSEMPVMGVL